MKEADKQYKVYQIPIFEIWVDDGFNCREGITPESVESTAASIEQDGLLFPVDVQPISEADDPPGGFKYKLICGFRRLTACKQLGWATIPARIRTGLTGRQSSLLNLIENLERKDLNILEEANALDKLFPTYRTIRSIAKELKKTEKWVQVRQHLILLSPWIQKAAASGRFTERDLQTIQHAHDPDDKARELIKATKEGRKSQVLFNGRQVRKKSEVKALIVQLLDEGFHPQLLRVIGWTIGEVNEDGLNGALKWLRDRKGWLKNG
jgi:ParB family chromosome partitioning protein